MPSSYVLKAAKESKSEEQAATMPMYMVSDGAIRVEYLVTFEDKEPHCRSAKGFQVLLQTVDDIEFSPPALKYRGIEVEFDIQLGSVLSGKHRYFHLRLTIKEEQQIDNFEDLLRDVRTVLTKASGRPPQTLWDGLSLVYALRAYPLLYELENTMRKLITKFMLINVGMSWPDETLPREVTESVRAKNVKPGHDYLYAVDFIQLANYLFNEYSTTSPSAVYDHVRDAKTADDLDLQQLKGLVPCSNWDRYFSELVDCESEYLRLRWERLYDKRNHVAHNRAVSRQDWIEIETLCSELRPKLQSAITSLDKVTLSAADRESVSESAASGRNKRAETYLALFQNLNQSLVEVALLASGGEQERVRVRSLQSNMRALVNLVTRKYHILPNQARKEIQRLVIIRNILVNQPDFAIKDEALEEAITSILQACAKVRAKATEFRLFGQFMKVQDEFSDPDFDGTTQEVELEFRDDESESDILR